MEILNDLEKIKRHLSIDDCLFVDTLCQKIDPSTGEVLNISDQCLEKIIKLISNLQNKKPLNPQVQSIIKDFKDGISVSEIANKQNCDLNTIIKTLRKNMGYKKIYSTFSQTQDMAENEVSSNRGLKWSQAEEEQLVNSYISGKYITDIASEHKRGLGGIRTRLRFLGFGLPFEELPEKWIFADKPRKHLCGEELEAFCNKINNTLTARINSYLSRRNIDYVVGDDNYNMAKKQILFFKYGVETD